MVFCPFDDVVVAKCSVNLRGKCSDGHDLSFDQQTFDSVASPSNAVFDDRTGTNNPADREVSRRTLHLRASMHAHCRVSLLHLRLFETIEDFNGYRSSPDALACLCELA